MVHVDIKKLGRIPDGGGWRMFGRGSDQDRASGRASDAAGRKGSKPGRGYRYLHHAVDGHSRVVHSEILDDEHKDTAAGFWRRASGFFASLGVCRRDDDRQRRLLPFTRVRRGVGAGCQAPVNQERIGHRRAGMRNRSTAR